MSNRGKWRQKKFVVAETITPTMRVYFRIRKLTEIVFQKHFSALTMHKEDLISIGMIKAITMLERGDFNSEKGNMINYLYSGIRNSMHNYYMKNINYARKEILVDEIPLVSSRNPLHDLSYEIDFSYIYRSIFPFQKRHGDLRGWCAEYLESLGCFIIHGVPPDVIVKVPRKEVRSKLQTILLWSIFDNIVN